MTQVPPPAAPAPPPPPSPASAERVRIAWQRRLDTDYVFSFWTAFGWSILTCGLYWIYIVYRLAQRDREHNLRRIDLLDGATAFAWEQATEQGIAEEVRPAFERIAAQMNELRRLSTEFRDPAMWALIMGVASFVGGGFIVAIVLYVLLDKDLVRHDRSEGAVEAELSALFERLGAPISPPDPNRLKGQHNYGGRIAVTVVTLGFYGLWWTNDVMAEGNSHFQHNWVWEDDLAGSVQQLATAA